MNGIELIAKERQEQIGKHGFDNAHDARYTNGELATAAAFLVHPKGGNDLPPVGVMDWRRDGTWDKMRGKPRIEQLAIAGALLAAEIDRIQDAEAPCCIPTDLSVPALDPPAGMRTECVETKIEVTQFPGGEMAETIKTRYFFTPIPEAKPCRAKPRKAVLGKAKA